MLFHLDESLLKFNPASEVHSRAIEALLSAYQNNYHVLFMDMKLLRQFDTQFGASLSLNARKALALLNNRMPTYRSELSIVKSKVIVVIDDEGNNIAKRDGDNWIVPLSHLSLGLLQTTLIGENDRDADFYAYLADRYRAINKYNAFSVASRARGGGGSGIGVAIQSYLASEISPCLCITDSDKLHPEYAASPTVTKCRELTDAPTKIVDYICLEEREVENFIPIPLLQKVISDYERFARDLEAIRGFKNSMWPYLDIKKGISLNWINRKDPPTQQYWSDISKHLQNRQVSCSTCDDDSLEENNGCSCTFIPGLGEKTLDRTLKYLKDSPDRETNQLLLADARWMVLGQAVLDYLIAPRGERSRGIR